MWGFFCFELSWSAAMKLLLRRTPQQLVILCGKFVMIEVV
jgi:hypothetical protein